MNFETTQRKSSLAPENRTDRSLRNYHYSLRPNPEECSSHPLQGGKLKSQMDLFYYQRIQTQAGFVFAKVFYLRSFLCAIQCTSGTKRRNTTPSTLRTCIRSYFENPPILFIFKSVTALHQIGNRYNNQVLVLKPTMGP